MTSKVSAFAVDLVLVVAALPESKPNATPALCEPVQTTTLPILVGFLRGVILDTLAGGGRLSRAPSAVDAGPSKVFVVPILGLGLSCIHAGTMATAVAALLITGIRSI